MDCAEPMSSSSIDADGAHPQGGDGALALALLERADRSVMILLVDLGRSRPYSASAVLFDRVRAAVLVSNSPRVR
jgi:hypothetical protein